MTDITKLFGYNSMSTEAVQRQEERAAEKNKYVMLGDQPVLREQYSALEEFCKQYSMKPEEMQETVKNKYSQPAFGIQDGYITKIITPTKYATIDNTLTIPETLTQLTTLHCALNQLTQLTIPEQLTQLTTLRCSFNQLTQLYLHDQLTQLTTLYCSNNPELTLALPSKNTPLKTVWCWNTKTRWWTKTIMRLRGVTVYD